MKQAPYPPESIGNIMATNVMTCGVNTSLGDILKKLTASNWDSIRSIFVVDEHHKLLGFVDMAGLTQTNHAVKAETLMQPVKATLHPEADQESAVFLAVKEGIITIPVINHEKKFLGAVTSPKIIGIMHDEHIEDALLTSGFRRAKGTQFAKLVTDRASLLVKSRIPWLLVGLVAGLGLGVISSLFEKSLQESIALAYFIPVVAYIADSVGTQSEAIAVRALATVKIQYWKYIFKELSVGFGLGVILGIIGGIGAALISGSSDIGLVVGLSLAAASTIAATLAVAIPFIFKALGKDPALGSGPLATALQDVISILVYFLFASLIL